MRRKTKTNRTWCMCDFSHASGELQVIARNSHWFMEMFVPVVIGRSNCFGFGFSTVIWKPLYRSHIMISEPFVWPFLCNNTIFLIGLLYKLVQLMFARWYMLWFKFIFGLKFFELVSILFAIVPDHGNEYTTKENKNWTSFKNFAPKLILNHNIYIKTTTIILKTVILLWIESHDFHEIICICNRISNYLWVTTLPVFLDCWKIPLKRNLTNGW